MAIEWKPSVRTQVTVAATVVVSVALVLGAAMVAVRTRQALVTDIDAQLVDRLIEIQASDRAGDLLEFLEPTGSQVGQVQIIGADGVVLAMTPGMAKAIRLDALPPPGPGLVARVTVEGDEINARAEEHYRIVAQSVVSDTYGPMTIYASTSMAPAEAAERYLRNWLLIGVPVLVAVASLLTFRVVGRALAPVEAMRREVDRIEATDLSGRVSAAATDDEIARLGETLNRMLARLEDSVSRQQLFAAAASHELRSPLSAIRTELEVSLAYPERTDWTQVADDVLVEVARLEVLSRDLRTLTRSKTVSASLLARFDLVTVLGEEVGRRQSAPGLTWVDGLERAVVSADVDAVTRVVRNLLDNAERHARSCIEVRSGCDGQGPWFSVANDGPGVPEAERERIFEPFLRLDEARTLDAGGSGLGLAIARSIMVSHGGSLQLVPGDDGPLFLARFPPPGPERSGQPFRPEGEQAGPERANA